MISPVSPPTDVVSHHGVANAARHVKANIDRRADDGPAATRHAERGHTPGANALDHLRANAQRFEAKHGGGATEADKTPQPTAPTPPPTDPTTGRLKPHSIRRSESWETNRFQLTA